MRVTHFLSFYLKKDLATRLPLRILRSRLVALRPHLSESLPFHSKSSFFCLFNLSDKMEVTLANLFQFDLDIYF